MLSPFRVPGSGFQVGFQVPGSFQVPCSRVPVPSAGFAISSALQSSLRRTWNSETKEPGTIERPGNPERTRNEEPNLELRTRNRNRTQSSECLVRFAAVVAGRQSDAEQHSAHRDAQLTFDDNDLPAQTSETQTAK